MALDPLSIAIAFVVALEGLLGVVLLVGVVRAIARRRRLATAGTADPGERETLLAPTAFAILGLALLAWPLLHLFLDSLVPLWPGVMCVEGVVRVGTGSPGATGLLPTLVSLAQWSKPLLLLLAGAWLVLHRANRSTRTAPLGRPLLLVLALLAATATADAAVQGTYLAVPKRDRSLAAGCCTLRSHRTEVASVLPFGPQAPPEEARTTLAALHLGLTGLLVLGLAAWHRRPTVGPPGPTWSLGLGLAAVASVPVGTWFLAEVASPALLDLPAHRCAYCVVSGAPESILGIGCFLAGALATVAAVLVARLGRHPEARAHLEGPVRGLLRTGLFGYLAAGLFAVVGVWVA
jgi:hypothetical protein